MTTTVGTTFTVNPTQALGAIRQVARSYEDLQRTMSKVQTQGRSLQDVLTDQRVPKALRDQVQQVHQAWQNYLPTAAARPLRRNLANSGVAPGDMAWALASGNHPLLSVNPRYLQPHLAHAGIITAPNGPTPGASGGVLDTLGQSLGMNLKGPASASNMLGALGLGGAAFKWLGAYNRNQDRMVELGQFSHAIGREEDGYGIGPGKFSDFQYQLEHATSAVHELYEEFQKHAIKMARLTGDTDAGGIARSTGHAVGLAHAYGLDADATVGGVGRLMQLTGSRGDEGGRRFAGMLAEAINRSELGARSAEVVEGLTSLAGSITARTMNASPFLDQAAAGLVAFNRSGIPGLTGAAGAAMLGQIDSAFAHGGNNGEASRVTTFGAIQQASGIRDPFLVKMIQEQGMFGSAYSLLGKGSKTDNIDAYLDYTGLRNRAPKGSHEWAVQNDMFGLYIGGNSIQGRAGLDALSGMNKAGTGALSELLGQLDVSPDKFNPSAWGRLATFAGSHRPGADGKFSAADLKEANGIARDGMVMNTGDMIDAGNKNLANLVSASNVELAKIAGATQYLATQQGYNDYGVMDKVAGFGEKGEMITDATTTFDLKTGRWVTPDGKPVSLSLDLNAGRRTPDGGFVGDDKAHGFLERLVTGLEAFREEYRYKRRTGHWPERGTGGRPGG